MQIKTKLTESDFIKLSFLLLWKRPVFKIVFIVVMISTVFTILADLRDGRGISSADFMGPVIFVLIFGLVIFISAKMNYRSNSRMKEIIEYRFGDFNLEMTGESFSSTLSWDKIHKVTKTRNWLLIWQSPGVANAIPLRDIWQGDITALKEILDRHRVKNDL